MSSCVSSHYGSAQINTLDPTPTWVPCWLASCCSLRGPLSQICWQSSWTSNSSREWRMSLNISMCTMRWGLEVEDTDVISSDNSKSSDVWWATILIGRLSICRSGIQRERPVSLLVHYLVAALVAGSPHYVARWSIFVNSQWLMTTDEVTRRPAATKRVCDAQIITWPEKGAISGRLEREPLTFALFEKGVG